MSIAYKPSVSPTDMQDGRRRAWKVEPNRFEVISRDSTERYNVEVIGGVPICECTAAKFGRPCWHAALVLARLRREAKACDDPGGVPCDDDDDDSVPDGDIGFSMRPTDAELFALIGAGSDDPGASIAGRDRL